MRASESINTNNLFRKFFNSAEKFKKTRYKKVYGSQSEKRSFHGDEVRGTHCIYFFGENKESIKLHLYSQMERHEMQRQLIVQGARRSKQNKEDTSFIQNQTRAVFHVSQNKTK